MAVTAADIKAFAPEFASIADSIVTTWLGWASGAVSQSVFGAATIDQAVTLWTCHQLKRGVTSGAIGPLTEQHVGPAGHTFASPQTVRSTDFATTSYGVAFQQLTRRYTAGGVLV